MPARKRPTAEDTITARRILLGGLTRDADIFPMPHVRPDDRDRSKG